ncbi:hypothetical protein VI817_007843 [Penicillium citrinum]|nr:hypothetical protein VI817_007843 [Penicillium citrinum]
MPHPVSVAEDDDVDTLNGRIASVKLDEREENPGRINRINPFAPYLENESLRFVDDLARTLIPKRLSGLQQTRWLEINETCPIYVAGRKFQIKYGISEASFQNWIKLLCGYLDFPVILLLNPSGFDVLEYEEMVQQSPTLLWLKDNLEILNLELRDVIVLDTFPMVTDGLSESKKFAEDWSELVADSFELTLTCLRYIRPQILISCQCCSKAINKRWGSFGDVRATELCSSEAGARQELVKKVNIYGHRMLVVQGVHPQNVVQYNPKMEGILKTLLTKVLGPFGQWKERRVTERREAAQREVVLAQDGITNGMTVLLKQMDLFEQICRHKNEIELTVTVGRVKEWRKQIENWAREMSGIEKV